MVRLQVRVAPITAFVGIGYGYLFHAAYNVDVLIQPFDAEKARSASELLTCSLVQRQMEESEFWCVLLEAAIAVVERDNSDETSGGDADVRLGTIFVGGTRGGRTN